jgi:hypothetical protein
MTWEPPLQEPTGPQGPFIEYRASYNAYGPAHGPQMPPPGADPRAGWGAPGPGVNASPLSLWEAVKQLPGQYWRVLTKPGTATFAYEAPKARWDVIWAQILGYALAAAVLATLAWLILVAFITAEFNSVAPRTGGPNPGDLSVFFLVPAPFIGASTFLAGVGGIFLGQGITYLLAKAFGGQGSFLVQVYTTLLFQVPIGLITVALSLIPFLGSIGSLGSIYGYVLQTFQLMVVHRLSTGKAIAVVLIPVGVGILLGIGLVFLYFIFILSVLGAMHPTDTITRLQVWETAGGVVL